MSALRHTQSLLDRFLDNLDNYELLSKTDQKSYWRFLEDRDSFSLVTSTDPAVRRNVKIGRFQQEKELKAKLEVCRFGLHFAFDHAFTDVSVLSQHCNKNKPELNPDDEALRELYLAEINLYAHEAFQIMEDSAQEISILKTIAAGPPVTNTDENDPGLRKNDESNYSDRLDVLSKGRNGPILSKTGVPLRPFTLLDKRSEMQKGVFQPGHNLPTMTIDEYLDEEQRRGNIIEGGGDASGGAPAVDEDDLDKADEETMKARAWDEFKEENPRGAGNTLNRG